MPDSKIIMYTFAVGSIACAVFLTYLYGANVPLHTSAAQIPVSEPHVTLDPSRIEGKAAIVYDPETRTVLFAKNANESLPLASLTKLMSAQTILSKVKDDTMMVRITSQDLKPSGDWGFIPGEQWPLNALIKFGLIASSNDAMAAAAAGALGSYTAVEDMNAQAAALGLTQTSFSNPTGLDINSDEAGAYGSVYDVALLASAFLKQFPQFFEATASPDVTITSGGHQLQATSTSIPLMSLQGLIGAKTGYTDLAGGNLVAAFDLNIGHPIIVAVLGSSHDGRFTDVKTLIEATRQAFAHP